MGRRPVRIAGVIRPLGALRGESAGLHLAITVGADRFQSARPGGT